MPRFASREGFTLNTIIKSQGIVRLNGAFKCSGEVLYYRVVGSAARRRGNINLKKKGVIDTRLAIHGSTEAFLLLLFSEVVTLC